MSNRVQRLRNIAHVAVIDPIDAAVVSEAADIIEDLEKREAISNAPLCKGSWLVGSACRKCSRCLEEAATIIPHLKVERRLLAEKLDKVNTFILPHPGWKDDDNNSVDISDEFKARCFDEVRKILHGD